MVTTTEEIRTWIERGREKGATHVIVVNDSFSYEYYPVYVGAGEDVRKVQARYDEKSGQTMESVMEVYFLAGDIEAQLSMRRSFTYE